MTPSNSSIDSLNLPISYRKRPRSPADSIPRQPSLNQSFFLKRQMARSKQGLSLNPLPLYSPSTFYYSLTNINDIDDQQVMVKKQKRTLSKLDVGYESEDETNHHPIAIHQQTIFSIKKSQSDYHLTKKNERICPSLTHSLPLFQRQQFLPTWWRHSITSAYDTCSNPDIDFSIEETKKTACKPSLLMYSKKYTKYNRTQRLSEAPSQASPDSNIKHESPAHPASHSYDASAEYTDPEQSENDVDVLSSDFNSASPVHNYSNSKSRYYNRYTTTTTTTTTMTTTAANTTTTGYSSDIELETTTTPSDTEDQQVAHRGKNTKQMLTGISSENEFD